MQKTPIRLDYAPRTRWRVATPLTRTRAIVFVLIGGSPLFFFWPFVMMLGDFRWVLWGICAVACFVMSWIAAVVMMIWHHHSPVPETIDVQVSLRRWNIGWYVLFVSLMLTATTLPTRAILLVHLPLFSYLTRGISPQPRAWNTVTVEGMAGLYRFRATDSNGAIHFELWPWFGLTRDDAWIAWAPNGSRPFEPGGAGEGELIGDWMWADVE